MLQSLIVKNFAIIDDLTINFFEGMTVITGDSGSGKSIIINAINLALGTRADKTVLKTGEVRGYIIAEFLVKDTNIINFLQENQLNDNNACILRRAINANGISKAFVNDIPISLNLLQQLAALLIDVFAQNQHQLLLQDQHQLQILDNYGGTQTLCSKVAIIASNIHSITSQITALENNAENTQQQLDFLQFQYQELIDANLDIEELTTIEEKYKIVSNAKELSNNINIIMEYIGDNNLGNLINKAHNLLESSSNIDQRLQAATQILESAKININECGYALNDYLNSFEMDNEEVQQLTERLSDLHSLSRKHNCQITELMKCSDNLSNQIMQVNTVDNALVNLKLEKSKLILQYQEKGNQLSCKRQAAILKLNKNITHIMQQLGMPGSEFMAHLITNDKINKYGYESVEFLIKANVGATFSPLKKTASGGELSRISLAIAVVTTSQTYAPSLIFDEIDVGISGNAASIVGEKLRELAQKYQVICITHIPQVAAKGHRHLLINKQQNADSVTTNVNYLSVENRIKELARILGGNNASPKTLALATEMINNAN